MAKQEYKEDERVAKCRACGEPLHDMVTFLGGKAGARQCLNRNCRKYGKREG